MPKNYHAPGCNCGGCIPDPDGDRRRLCSLDYGKFPCGCQYNGEGWRECEVHTVQELMAALAAGNPTNL